MVLGLGHDVVDVAAFAVQLAEPGSRMRGLFSARELRQAAARAQAKHDGEAVHLAAKWAGKESVLKAWCEALGKHPYPFTLDDFPWREIEILDDSRGVPHVVFSDQLMQSFIGSISETISNASDLDTTSGSLPDCSRLFSAESGDRGIIAQSDDQTASVSSPAIRLQLARRRSDLHWHISLSHDGPIASAVTILD